jgi:VanZ family protein
LSVLKTVFRVWVPLVGYCLLIYIQSSRPARPMPDVFLVDKVAHFLGYALLGVLFARAYRTTSLGDRHGLLLALAALSAALYGLSDEWHQSYVPYRSAEPGDLAADVMGGICGAYLYLKRFAARPFRGLLLRPDRHSRD